MSPPSADPALSNSPHKFTNTYAPTPPRSARHSRDTSRVSIASKTSSVRSHQEYLDSLEMPTQEEVERISEVQEHKEAETIKRRLSEGQPELNDEEKQRAAELIQRNYRGHRERRMLQGFSLDPSTRWVEAVKEARYRHLLEPMPRESIDAQRLSMENCAAENGTNGRSRGFSAARQNWKKVGLVTRRAGGDEDSDSEESEGEEGLSLEEKEQRRKRKIEKKAERQKAAKIMDLQYFLEMVDLKHRYGSNLRTYHEEWKKSDTKENFFYWLDYGEGRYIDCQGCPRERLEKEQVRYLSKEERLDYLVKIDKDGKLRWAKNGALIDTTEKYKDSIHGIVPDSDNTTPSYTPADGEAAHRRRLSRMSSSTSTSSSSRSSDSNESARADKYATPQFDKAKGVKKVKHVSAATIFNKLLRGSVKKNTWIFVADTSFRLYVGIKQSGAFQHSSFLHGSRISAAGLIKIKNGRLSKLSPLSGHYRPPVSNFKAFVHSMKEEGVDMSHVSISRSYAVLVGLEAYVKTRRRGKKLIAKFLHHRDKIIAPEEVAKKEEEQRDKSESAALERKFLEAKQQAEEGEREENRADIKLMQKLHIKPTTPQHGGKAGGEEGTAAAVDPPEEGKKNPDIQAPGTGPENAIAPEGTRNA